jgi:N-ethylmaleimide reductase
MTATLFEPFQLGDLLLANRLVMAPMTRNRADENGVATPPMATHYRQRASAGLIITESSPVSPQAIVIALRRDSIRRRMLKVGDG